MPDNYRSGRFPTDNSRTQIQREIEKMPAVSDQNGWLISIVGFGLAYLLSAFFLGSFSNQKITDLLNEALKNSHPSFQVRFEKAQLNLREGFMPRFRMSIFNIQITSADPCYFAPQVFASRADLPISWLNLLIGLHPIQRVVIQDTELRLKTDRSACMIINSMNEGDLPTDFSSDSGRSPSQENLEDPVTISKNVFFQEQPSLKGIEIGRLRVFLNSEVETFVEIEDLEFNIEASSGQKIRLWSKIHLFKEKNVQDFFTHGVLVADFEQGEHQKLNAEIRGHVREGSYLLKTSVDLKTGRFDAVTDFDHVPFSPILHLLKKFQFIETDFPAKKVWATFKTESLGNLNELEKVQIRIHPIEIFGEVGNLSTQEIQVSNLNQPQVSPFALNIRKLDLDQIAEQLPRLKANYFHQLGVFQGVLKFSSLKDASLSGIHSGLEFIFSNEGAREIQSIQNIFVEGLIQGKNLSLFIDRADFNEGLFQGKLSYRKDENEKESVQVAVDEMRLSPRVQTVMTSGGSLGAIAINYQRDSLRSIITDEKLDFFMPRLVGYGMSMEKVHGVLRFLKPAMPKSNLGQSNSRRPEYELKTDIQKLVVQGSSNLSRALAPLAFDPEKNNDIDQVQMLFELNSFDALRWKKVSGKTRQGVYQIEGGWNKFQNLDGRVDLISGQKKYTWNIEGKRDQPIFTRRVRE